MANVLIRPYILGYKNRLLGSKRTSFIFNRETMALALSLLLMYGVYRTAGQMLFFLGRQSSDITVVAVQLLDMVLFGLFSLLLFSNFVAALGYFFLARDLSLLLSYPVSSTKLYFARLTQAIVSSSWMFITFTFPVLIAFKVHFNFPYSFIVLAALGLVPLVFIASGLSSILVILFVNIFPAHRLKEILVVSALTASVVVLLTNEHQSIPIATQQQSLAQLQQYMTMLSRPEFVWMPSRWLTEMLSPYFHNTLLDSRIFAAVLFSSALGILALGTLCFEALFERGWTRTTQIALSSKATSKGTQPELRRFHFPLPSQFRAMLTKELRMFLRDTTQSLQLLMLLGLSLIYLYQFRALRLSSAFENEAPAWWQALLCLFNLSLGSCVVAAISTRFVYPTVSQEGQAYYLIRCAPLSIKQFLRIKFWLWLLPISILTAVFVASGAWAIQAPFAAIMTCLALGVAISIGIVGLSIGIGGVYVRFDWDSPTEIAASFGSLVYMFCILALISLTLIPGIYLTVVACDPKLITSMAAADRYMAQAIAYTVAFSINIIAARKALGAAQQRLIDLEK